MMKPVKVKTYVHLQGNAYVCSLLPKHGRNKNVHCYRPWETV